ncbi:alpha/beta hydrolase [Lacticaseibacillus mingshuiensis]|uniref:alpha/beta hydrolase n=1 Tax=Lacticaseibacillus mingshuiensis TaxID=2799574 RepID=UPI0019527F9B|nr:alpha/beta fold hydrolase [Lacticaseibacillus mingshuiensis]
MQVTVRAPQPLALPGDRPTGVLLFHAYTGSPNDVNSLAHALAREGFAVQAPLFAGHGTPDPMAVLAARPTQWWAQVQAAVETLAATHLRVAVFGLSLGGIFAMQALEQLAVDCGGVFASPVMPGAQQIAPNFMKYATYLDRLAERPDRTTALETALKPALAANQAAAATVATGLGQIRQPVFIAQGGRDEMIDPARSRALAQALPHAAVTFRWYAEAGHVLTVNSARQRLTQDVIQFLNEKENEEQ